MLLLGEILLEQGPYFAGMFFLIYVSPNYVMNFNHTPVQLVSRNISSDK